MDRWKKFTVVNSIIKAFNKEENVIDEFDATNDQIV